MSHDINRDPEMWDLCARFGDKALRCWLEILSVADRNEGDVPGSLDSISTAVSWAIRCRSTKTRQILDSMLTLNWLRVDGCLKVVNWAKYHITREDKKHLLASLPSEPSYPNLPILSKDLKNAQPPTAAPEVHLEVAKSQKIDSLIKESADPIYNSDQKKFARLIVWIKDKERRDYPAEVIIAALRDFWVREQKSKVNNWWPYIEHIFTKLYGRWNEENATKLKMEDRVFVEKLTVGLARKVKV